VHPSCSRSAGSGARVRHRPRRSAALPYAAGSRPGSRCSEGMSRDLVGPRSRIGLRRRMRSLMLLSFVPRILCSGQPVGRHPAFGIDEASRGIADQTQLDGRPVVKRWPMLPTPGLRAADPSMTKGAIENPSTSCRGAIQVALIGSAHHGDRPGVAFWKRPPTTSAGHDTRLVACLANWSGRGRTAS
jgi:hypothetical protein